MAASKTLRSAAARSLAIRQRRFDPDNPEIATALLSLGRVYMESGALSAADDTLRRALAIRTRVFGAEDPVTALALDELAKTQLLLGRAESAEVLCRRAIRGKSRGLGRGHPDVARSWRVLAGALAAQGRPAEACQAALECERIMRDHLAASVARMPENDALAYEATRVSGLGCAARLAARSDAGPAERRSVLDAIVRSRALVLDARLSRGTGPRTSEGLPEVLRGLPQGAVLVSLLRCDPEPAPFTADARYVAFVVGAGDSAVAAVDLGAAGELDSLVGCWRAAITRRASHSQRGVNTRTWGVALRRRVWEPLQRSITGAPRVFVVPDGALGAVDWYALPAPGGGFLVESGPLLERLSTERELSAPLASAKGSGLLVAVCGGGATGFAPLPQAAREVRDVTQEWSDAASGTRRAVILSHPRATVPALRQAIQGCEVLHLSAHGVFAGQGVDPERSLRRPVGAAEQGASVLERSGLVLAGAADRRNAAGFLNARAAASLDLRGARWVVLSGCETGRGRFMAREGSLGLQRAFKLAGARVVITSLWPVEDRAAREWMAALYRARWQRGLSTGESVRAAARERLQARRRLGLPDDPAVWAGFVASGLDDPAITAGVAR
ncbi:MAG: CHAT domain-containing tetratricopeptide repeat protein [Candidatus Eisenbacteria bacterium]